MEWQYKISVPACKQKASPEENWFLLGSCFATHLGNDLCSHFISSCTNPMGIVYHPGAILSQLKAITEGRSIGYHDLRENQDLFSHFLFHSCFNGTNPKVVLQAMNHALGEAADKLKQASYVVITLGTALGYYLKETDEIVSNCHRFSSEMFYTRRVSPEECAQILKQIKMTIEGFNSRVKIIFTVSPVKYYREGVREHLLSKSVLLLASRVLEGMGDYYFPAYELMTEELRDYRFYGADFCHPTTQAIDYILMRFREVFFNEKAHVLYGLADDYIGLANHRIMHPGTKASERHVQKLGHSLQDIIHAFPHVRQMIPTPQSSPA